MANNFGTWNSIRAWAWATFPDSFAKLEGLPIPKMTRSYAPHPELDADTRVIEVGALQGRSTTTSYAWIENETVKLGHIVGDCMDLHSDTGNPEIVFAKPFCWVKPAEDEIGAARFDALVRYYFCIQKPTRISYQLAATKSDFRGACEDIAEHMTREASKHASADRCVRPKLSHEMHLSNDSAPTTSSTSTPTPPILASATSSASAVQSVDNHAHDAESIATPNAHLQALDQAFALFKASLNDQANAAEAAANHEKAELTSQIHSLERRIADAGEERERLEASLEEARGESEKWKVQYETLRKSVLATVER